MALLGRMSCGLKLPNNMKGLICAGGNGTRLAPITQSINKHLVPILNQPMILYPLNTLRKMGIVDIMIVSGGEHIGGIAEFLGGGSKYNVNLTYKVQEDAGGIAQAVMLSECFVGKDDVAVILGDNVFESVPTIRGGDNSAHLFVKNLPCDEAKRFGVILPGDSFITEKPEYIPADNAPVITGLYIYPNDVFSIIEQQEPSARGEYEISDTNNYYLRKNRYSLHTFEGFWSDAGTVESLKKTIDWVYGKGIK